MNTKRRSNNNWAAKRASLILALLVMLVPGAVFGQEFEGAEYCKTCHEANYNDWTASGHPYKLMKGEEAKHRPIPLPQGYNWPIAGEELKEFDVSYVIGGYKWKSRYIDKDGYIITTTCEENPPFVEGCTPRDGVNQYNYLTGTWNNYNAGVEKKPYNCGTCHTTNWVADDDWETDGDLSDNQDGLPGMHGTFDAGGVHCEQCHGNGLASMQIDDSAEACGVCHHREASPEDDNFVNVIPAGGGFIKHHEQYNEHLAGPHAAMKCVTCHDPHKRGEYSIKEDRDCTNCHVAIAESYATTSMADYNVECKDCHMPFATKSALPTGPHAGDLQTHIFYINTDAEANMFTEDGSYVALDENGKGAVTMDFACQRCHETAELTELARFAKNFHGLETDAEDNLLDELHYAGINPGLTGNWKGDDTRNGEGFLLEVAYSNGKLVLTGSFYTYDSAGNQVWLIGYGEVTEGSNTATVNLTITDGPSWGAAYDSTAVNLTAWGTADFIFPACGAGMVSFAPNAEMVALGYSDHGYDLNRDLTVPGIACPIMQNNAN